MKKKIVILTMMVLSLTACSGSSNTTPTQSATTESKMSVETTATTETTDVETSEDSQQITVEKELFDVVITIPTDYVGETTQEELDVAAKEGGYKIKLNDDGSATYTMTKSQHRKMMEEMSSSIDQSLSEMVESEDYPNFTNIEHNSDYTSFTITTKSKELDLGEAFSALGFYMYGGLYNSFNGTKVDNIHVDFVNLDSGEIISSSDSNEQ